MATQRVKFSTQLDKKLLKSLKTFAEEEGRQVQSVVEEAITELLIRERGDAPGEKFVSAYNQTLKNFSQVLEKLSI